MPSEKLISKLPEETQKRIRESTKLGKREYAKIKKAEQEALRKVADDFLNVLTEKVDSLVFIGDSEHLAELVRQFDIISGYQVIRALQEKGLGKEITALCDKAGGIEIKNKEGNK